MSKGIEQEIYKNIIRRRNDSIRRRKIIEECRQSNIVATEEAMHRLKDLPNSNQPEPEVMSWARLFFQW